MIDTCQCVMTCQCVITCGHELKMRTFSIVVVPTPAPKQAWIKRKVRLNHPWMWFYKEMETEASRGHKREQ